MEARRRSSRNLASRERTHPCPHEYEIERIDDLLGSHRGLSEALEEVSRPGVRLLMQTAIKAEVIDVLGRIGGVDRAAR